MGHTNVPVSHSASSQEAQSEIQETGWRFYPNCQPRILCKPQMLLTDLCSFTFLLRSQPSPSHSCRGSGSAGAEIVPSDTKSEQLRQSQGELELHLMQASQDLLLPHLLGQEGFFWKPDLYRTQLQQLQHPGTPQRAPDCGVQMAGKPT